MQELMFWIFDNGYVILGLLALIVVAVVAILRFFKLPTEKQKAKVKEWLIWACIEAEKALQSGTGKLKLREVWNRFVSVPAFSIIARIISFDEFEKWVTEALETVKNMLISNPSLATYVYGDNAKLEVEKLKFQLTGEIQDV